MQALGDEKRGERPSVMVYKEVPSWPMPSSGRLQRAGLRVGCDVQEPEEEEVVQAEASSIPLALHEPELPFSVHSYFGNWICSQANFGQKEALMELQVPAYCVQQSGHM